MADIPEDDGEVWRVGLDPEDSPAVLTEDLCDFFGGCQNCPGFITAGTVNPDIPDPDEPVFSVLSAGVRD